MYFQSVDNLGANRAPEAPQPAVAPQTVSTSPRRAVVNHALALSFDALEDRAASETSTVSRTQPGARPRSAWFQLYQACQRNWALPDFALAFDEALDAVRQLPNAATQLHRLEHDVFRSLANYVGANEGKPSVQEFAPRAFTRLLVAFSAVKPTDESGEETRDEWLNNLRTHIDMNWPTDERMHRMLSNLEDQTLRLTDPMERIGFRTSLTHGCKVVLEALGKRKLEDPKPWLGEIKRACDGTAHKLGIGRPSTDDLFRRGDESVAVRALGDAWESMYPEQALRLTVGDIERPLHR